MRKYKAVYEKLIEGELHRGLQHWRRGEKARMKDEDESVIGQRIATLERNFTGDITSVVLDNGRTLRPRMNDSGEAWIEAELGAHLDIEP